MEYRQFKLVTGTNDDLEDRKSWINMGEIAGDNAFASITQNGLTNYSIVINTVDGLTGVTTNFKTQVMSFQQAPLVDGPQYAYAAGRIYGDVIIAVVLVYYRWATGPPHDYAVDIQSLVSTDGGSSWNSYNIFYDDQYTSPSTSMASIHDIFRIGSNYYIAFTNNRNNRFWIKTSFGNPIAEITDSNGPYEVYIGHSNGTNYQFVFENTANDLILERLTPPTTMSLEETLTVSPPTTYAENNQLYWRIGLYEYLIDVERYYVRYDGGTWVSFTDAGTTTNAPIWGYVLDYYVLLYKLWKDSLYKILEKGLPVKLQVITDDAYVGMTDWVANGSDAIYQLEWTALNASIGKVASELYKVNVLTLKCQIEPFENQYVIVGDGGNIIFEGYVESYKTNSEDYLWFCVDPIQWDLKTKVNKSYTAKTAHYIIKDILDSYCIYLYYDAGISTPATTYTISFKDKRVLDVLRWADSRAGLQTSIRATHEVFWDDYVDEGTIITDSDIESVTMEPLTGKKYARFVIYGGYYNGQRLKSESIINPSFNTYIDEFPEIVGGIYEVGGIYYSTELDNMRIQLETDWNVTISLIHIKVVGKGFIETGTEVALTITQFSITSETWYVISADYDAITKIATLILSDATIQPGEKDLLKTDIYNLRQDVGKVEKATNDPSGSGITPASLTLGGHLVDDIDITSEASDADDHLMTALAIANRINDKLVVVGCSISRSAVQAYNATTWTEILFTSENWDTNAFHSLVSNTGRITIPAGKAGLYQIHIYFLFDAIVQGDRNFVQLWINGAAAYYWKPPTPFSSSSFLVFDTVVLRSLSVGDYLQIKIFADTAGNALILYNGPQFDVVRIGDSP